MELFLRSDSSCLIDAMTGVMLHDDDRHPADAQEVELPRHERKALIERHKKVKV